MKQETGLITRVWESCSHERHQKIPLFFTNQFTDVIVQVGYRKSNKTIFSFKMLLL